MMKRSMRAGLLMLAGCLAGGAGVMRGQMAAPAVQETVVPSGLLTREKAAGFLPDKVFYRGQSASVQARNSAGVAFDGGKLMLVALVDTSGYSSAVSQRYQAYLLTEVALDFGGKVLVPGCYGVGFVAGDKMVVMDVGANELLEAPTAKDEAMKRPNPLQILAEATQPGHYRLLMGRTYVEFSRAAGK